ncbi:MAG: hypothetical protein ABIH63_01575 [archaeon]
MKRTLAVVLLTAAFGYGCDVNSLLFSKPEPKSILENMVDVDGDRRPDIVFAVSDAKSIPVEKSQVTLRRYFVFFRRNLGEGKYDAPKLLFVTDKEEIMKGIPYEDIERESFKDPKRAEYLRGLIDNASY